MAEALKDPKTTPDYVWGRVEFGLPPRGTLDTFNGEKGSQRFERFARNGTWQVPTLVEEQSFALLISGGLMDQRGMNLVPEVMQKSWDLPNILKPLSAEDRQDLVKIVPMMLDVVGRMHRAGVRILAGTDAPWLVVPGFSLHDESRFSPPNLAEGRVTHFLPRKRIYQIQTTYPLSPRKSQNPPAWMK